MIKYALILNFILCSIICTGFDMDKTSQKINPLITKVTINEDYDRVGMWNSFKNKYPEETKKYKDDNKSLVFVRYNIKWNNLPRISKDILFNPSCALNKRVIYKLDGIYFTESDYSVVVLIVNTKGSSKQTVMNEIRHSSILMYWARGDYHVGGELIANSKSIKGLHIIKI